MKYETLEEKHQARLASYERSKASKLARLALERTKQPTVSEWFKNTPIGMKLHPRIPEKEWNRIETIQIEGVDR